MSGPAPYYNVRDYGATGDGRTDDTGAINAAIAAAAPSSPATGDTVFLPAGRYRVSSTLTVPHGLCLLGTGWDTPGSQASIFAGTWIFVEEGADFSPVTISGSGGAVRNLGFNVFNPNNTGAPASAGPMIHIMGNNALVEHICLYNPYGGIYLDGAAQAAIRRIFGQPLNYGIMIDRSFDTNYIDCVHFWPYSHPAGTAPAAYQLANGTAILLYRCDNPHISNVLALHYNRGLSLSGSAAGRSHKVHLINADFDGCLTGIHMGSPGYADYASLQMANVTTQAPAVNDGLVGHGIWIEKTAPNTVIQASNLRVTFSGLSAIRIDADNVSFYGENVFLEGWKGDCGFYIASPSSFAYLGVGFAAGPGRNPFAPKSQFRMPRLA
ncbi:MAG TPA: glycosyl hydrolase family 28-related protein [Acidimicrobiales bacterium]|nr:glycosyl hydrolase family 28-related protein [Acidimicrobiales bacterium]